MKGDREKLKILQLKVLGEGIYIKGSPSNSDHIKHVYKLILPLQIKVCKKGEGKIVFKIDYSKQIKVEIAAP